MPGGIQESGLRGSCVPPASSIFCLTSFASGPCTRGMRGAGLPVLAARSAACLAVNFDAICTIMVDRSQEISAWRVT